MKLNFLFPLTATLLLRPYFLITILFSQVLIYSLVTGSPFAVLPLADNLPWAMLCMCLSCSTACNGSLLPNTLALNTFVAMDKDLHGGSTLLSQTFFFFFFWTPVFYINIGFSRFLTHDMGVHLSFHIHPPLSTFQSLLFFFQPTKVRPSMDSITEVGKLFL